MKPKQTLAEAQNLLFASLCSLAEYTVYHADSTDCNSDKDTFVKAQQNFSKALRNYAEALVYDAYSRYDLDEKTFFTRAAYEEITEALANDEVIPMEQVAAELGLKW